MLARTRYAISLPLVVVAVFGLFLFVGFVYAAGLIAGRDFGKLLLG